MARDEIPWAWTDVAIKAKPIVSAMKRSAFIRSSPSFNLVDGPRNRRDARALVGGPLLRSQAVEKPLGEGIGGPEDVCEGAHGHVARARGEQSVDQPEHGFGGAAQHEFAVVCAKRQRRPEAIRQRLGLDWTLRVERGAHL